MAKGIIMAGPTSGFIISIFVGDKMVAHTTVFENAFYTIMKDYQEVFDIEELCYVKNKYIEKPIQKLKEMFPDLKIKETKIGD